MLMIKRVYERASWDDGIRILVDRLWPRGISKSTAHIDSWLKEIAPSDSLRKWFSHSPERWEEFELRYIKELKDKKDMIKKLKRLAQENTVTLVYSARDKVRNNAVVLFKFLSKR